MSAYNSGDLGINEPIETPKCADNYQNMQIMLAVLHFKKWAVNISSDCAKNYASAIHKSLFAWFW